MKKWLVLGAAAITTIGAAAAKETVRELSVDCERALALSAAPVYMRERASVYVLGKDGFVRDREGDNGYACIVVREDTDGVVPQCFDAVGQRSHLPVHLDEARKLRSGKSWGAIAEDRKAGFESGDYTPADGFGVVYMASDYNYIETRGGKIRVAPHVMYHAPNLTNDDVGAQMPDAFDNFGMPFIQGSGPMGFMIGFTERATDSSDVEATCAGQLPDPSDWKVFPDRN